MGLAKVIVFGVNGLFFCLGVAIACIAGFAISEFQTYSKIMSMDGLIITAVMGGGICLISLITIIGAKSHSKALLFISSALMLAIILVQLIGGLITFQWAGRLDSVNNPTFNQQADPWVKKVDNLSNCTYNECCARNVSSPVNLPKQPKSGFNFSPCNKGLFTVQPAACIPLKKLNLLVASKCAAPGQFRQGVTSYLKSRIGVIGGIMIGFVALEFLSFFFSMVVMCKKKEDFFSDAYIAPE